MVWWLQFYDCKGCSFQCREKASGKLLFYKGNSDNWFQMLLKFFYRKLEYNEGVHSVICMIETYPHSYAYAFTCFYIQVYIYAHVHTVSAGMVFLLVFDFSLWKKCHLLASNNFIPWQFVLKRCISCVWTRAHVLVLHTDSILSPTGMMSCL